MGNILFSAFFIILLCIGAFLLITFTIAFFGAMNEAGKPEYQSPESLPASYFEFQPEDYSSKEWLDFQDLNEGIYQYGTISVAEGGFPGMNHATVLFRTADNLENPTMEKILDYAGWTSDMALLLDLKEKSLKKKVEPVALEADYGAQRAYRLGDTLVIRYPNRLFRFHENTTRELVESEACAAFMKQEYGE